MDIPSGPDCTIKRIWANLPPPPTEILQNAVLVEFWSMRTLRSIRCNENVTNNGISCLLYNQRDSLQIPPSKDIPLQNDQNEKWMDFIRCAAEMALLPKLRVLGLRRFGVSTAQMVRAMTTILFSSYRPMHLPPSNYSRNFHTTSRNFSTDIWKKVFWKCFPY